MRLSLLLLAAQADERVRRPAIAPHSLGGGYVNFTSADDQSKVAENYGVNYPRLQDVKRRYDPGNLFHLNQNIQPSAQ